MRSRDEINLRQFDPWPGDPTRPPVSRGCGACGETTGIETESGTSSTALFSRSTRGVGGPQATEFERDS